MSFYFTFNYNIDEIVNLRKMAFGLKFQERVRLEGLNWNNTDKNSLHFSLRSDQMVLATLRITFYRSQSKLEEATQIQLTQIFQTPYALLARAATHPNYENYDLHAKLRVLALEYCIQQNIDVIFGSLKKKSKRLNHLLNHGYEIISTLSGWPDSYIQNDGDVVLIAIQTKNKISEFIERERQRMKYYDKVDFTNLVAILY